MTTQYQLEAEEGRDLDAELVAANEAYEAWLLQLPREACGSWSEADNMALVDAPF